MAQMLGPLFLYSTSPAPHESAILTLAQQRRTEPSRPLSAVAMQTALPEPNDADLDGLRNHFCTQGIEVELSDSGLATREDAFRESVAQRLAAADLVLITGGSPELLYERTVDTPALTALRVASENGTVIAGCSAGAVVVGAGMVLGKGADRRSLALWGWLSRIVVAPHFGLFDIEPWIGAFPHCTVLGIPNDAMALITHGAELECRSDVGLVLRTGDDVRRLGRGQRMRLR